MTHKHTDPLARVGAAQPGDDAPLFAAGVVGPTRPPFEPPPPRRVVAPTSADAFIASDRRGRQARVLALVVERGAHGLTLDEASVQLGIPPHSLSSCFSALGKLGLITRPGQTRATRSGAAAAVWVAARGGAHAG